MANERSLKDIKDDIKLITTNKLSMSQSKLLFIGIVFEIILRKDLFPKRNNLQMFIDKIFLRYFKDKEPIRDYVYNSRANLAARIQKNILNDIEYAQIIEIVKELYKILPEDEIKTIKNKKRIDINKELVEWMNFIGVNE